ncbi:MAG: magnesium transporter [Verrucomicrobiae bacterium]|nr:magnesium transporter [Verrucomicrobiae bacterium]
MENQEEHLEKLQEYVDSGNAEAAATLLEELPRKDGTFLIDRMVEARRERLMSMLPPDVSANLIAGMHEAQAIEILDGIHPENAVEIFRNLDSEKAADLLGVLEEHEAEAILQEMQPDEAADARRLLAYDENTAGGLMRTEFLAYPVTSTVRDVVEDMRENAEKYSDFDVQYAYLIDSTHKLKGVMRLRDLLLSSGSTQVAQLMIPDPVSVHHSTTQEELARIFTEKKYLGMPVVDSKGRLLGVVLRKSVRAASAEAIAEDFLKVSGLGGKEELRSMPLHLRSRRRLSWLSINIFLNIMAASVIAVFQDTLAQVIALAVFLPIISDMSGCSGSQAVAVSIRELTLGLVRPTEFFRVLFKELGLGMVNGLALGLLIAGVAWIWKGNPWLGFVVGAALMANTVVAVCLGGLIPLILKRFQMDPALASGPILTTVTDMCGFFLVLSMATLLLPHLTL